MDDGLIGTRYEKGHLEDMSSILSFLKEVGTNLNLTHFNFGILPVELLGNELLLEGFIPLVGNMRFIKDSEDPSYLTEILRFLGLI